MITFALTGGIASGKSTVARLFAEWGVPVIDADQIARSVVQPGTPALAAIVARFGSAICAADGSLNRAALAQLVFSDPNERAALNAIVHPVVQREVLVRRNQLKAQGTQLACYDVPLLFETGQEEKYRPVVVVTADDKLRVERLIARDGLDRAAAELRLSSQMPLDQKVARAEFVVVNNGSLAELNRTSKDAIERVRRFIA